MKKDIIITFRTTTKLKEKMKNQSEKAHMSMSKYIERLLLNKNIVVIEEGKNIFFELNKIGNNVNQIAKKVNLDIATNKDLEGLNDVASSLKGIWQLLNSLMSK